jgi:uncharacterized membrane protein required for colicin V production
MFTFGVIIVLLLTVTWGYLRGALHDVLGLAALAVAYLVSEPFGRTLGERLAQHPATSAASAYVIARVSAGLAIYISLKVSAAVANRLFGQDEAGVTRPWNRNLGALLGLAYGLALVLIVLFFADSLHKAGSQNAFVQAASGSWLGRRVSTHNPADRFLLTDLLRLLRTAREDPVVLERLRQDPRVQALLDDPTLKAVLEDRDLVEALHAGQFGKVFSNPHLKALLADKQLLHRIVSPDEAPDLNAVIREVMQEREQERERQQPATP